MNRIIIAAILQALLLSLLITKDKNDGEKELFKNQTWRASHVVIVILSIYVYMFFIYLLTMALSASIPWIINTIIYQIYLLILICFLIFRTKQDIRILGFKKFELKKNSGIALISAFYILLPYLSYISGHSESTISFARQIWGLGRLSGSVLLIIAVLIGPIIEESLYRGIMYSPYRKKYGANTAIVLNAVLFSVMHYTAIGSVYWTYFVGGCIFGLLYEKTESIVPGIIVHSSYNLLSIGTGLYALYTS